MRKLAIGDRECLELVVVILPFFCLSLDRAANLPLRLYCPYIVERPVPRLSTMTSRLS